MSIVIELVILAAAVACAAGAGAIYKKTSEANRSLHRLLAFLDGVHLEHRKEQQDDQLVSSAFRKTLTDELRGCRDSIDAIRSATDELSVHRRETMVEMSAPPGDRDSMELMTRVVPRPTAAELGGLPPSLPGIEPPGSAQVLPSGPARIAAGLSRPKSSPREPPSTRPMQSDPPPRSRTMLGMPAPPGPHALPVVVPPPKARPHSTATLPSMGAVRPPGGASAFPATHREEKEG